MTAEEGAEGGSAQRTAIVRKTVTPVYGVRMHNKRRGDKWVAYNRVTRNVISRPTTREIAEQVAHAMETSGVLVGRAANKAVIDDSILKEAEFHNRQRAARKVYAAHYCTRATYGAMMDDPKAYIHEAGLPTLAAPQLVGVWTTPAKALKGGMDAAMADMREDDTDPETGDPYLPGANPLDMAVWEDAKEAPIDETCPLTQEFFCANWPREELRGKPMGRPYYEAFLVEPSPSRQADTDEDDYTWACVVVQELELDREEASEW